MRAFNFQKKIGEFQFTPEQFLVLAFFFFNTIFLPLGLLYTTILTPIFLLDLILKKKARILTVYFIISLVISIFYWYNGVEMMAYLKSFLLFSSAFIFIVWAYFFLKKKYWKLGSYFGLIVSYNLLLTLFALLWVFIPGLNTIFWNMDPIHPAIPIFPRLKLLVYEPSFYSLQLAPIFLYYLMSYLFSKQGYLLGLILVSIPLMLSLSFGVIGGLMLAVLIILGLNLFSLLKHPKAILFFVGLLGVIALIFYLGEQAFPDNAILTRLNKVFEGDDTSANGRTWEAFLLAWKILENTNFLFGAGLGQVKIIGHEIIVGYYNYYGEWANTVRIPNTMAETLATFGLLGVAIRLFIQIGLFFYTEAFKNFYRSSLFTFVFIYQFTGSYLTNIYEYLLWVLVFLPIFPRFDRHHLIKKP